MSASSSAAKWAPAVKRAGRDGKLHGLLLQSSGRRCLDRGRLRMAEPPTDGSPSTLSREQSRKVAPLDLSGLALGNYRDDPDHLRHFEIGQARAAECLQSLGVRVALEHHGGPDFFTILGVRYAEGCRLSNRGMLQEHVVDLRGCD